LLISTKHSSLAYKIRSKTECPKCKAKIELYQWKSYQRNFKVVAEKPSTIRVRTYYYPAWHLYVNSKSYPIEIFDDGTILFAVQPGHYSVQLVYQKTLAFTVGIIASMFSILIVFIYWFSMKKIPLLR